MTIEMNPIGKVRSSLTDRKNAPRQPSENAPDAWIELDPMLDDAWLGMKPDDKIIVLTWLHQSRRETLQVHPRSIATAPLTGVFATRSPDRPNPIGLHETTVLEITKKGIHVAALECIDGTPVLDIKPMLCP